MARGHQQQKKRLDRPVEDSATDRLPSTDAPQPLPEKTDADVPPLETLDENSDYKDFLSPKVSKSLRRLALRKLFHSAKFNIVDGLDDYDEDFRVMETLGDVITADMRHQVERQQEKDRRKLAEEQPNESAARRGQTDVAANETAADEERPAEEPPSLDTTEDETPRKG